MLSHLPLGENHSGSSSTKNLKMQVQFRKARDFRSLLLGWHDMFSILKYLSTLLFDKNQNKPKQKKNEMRKMTSIQKQQACYYTTAQRITTNKTFGWIHCWWCSWILVDCYNNNKSFPSISSALLTVSVSPLRRRTKKCGFPLVTLLTWLLRTTNNFCLLFFLKHKVVFVYSSILL